MVALTAAFPRQYHCPPRIPCPPTSRDVPALTAGASGRCGPAVPSRCVRFKFKLAVPRPCWGPGRQGGLNAGRPGVCCDPPAQGKDGGRGRPRERVRGPALGHADGGAARSPRAEGEAGPSPWRPCVAQGTEDAAQCSGTVGRWPGFAALRGIHTSASASSWPRTPRRRGPPPRTPGVIAWQTGLGSAVGALPGRLQACLPPAAGRRSGQQAPRSRSRGCFHMCGTALQFHSKARRACPCT